MGSKGVRFVDGGRDDDYGGGGGGGGSVSGSMGHRFKSAPQSSMPIPIGLESDSDEDPLDPDVGSLGLSRTFVPPHEIVRHSEFSLWEIKRKPGPNPL